MPRIAIVFGTLLILVGLVGYVASGAASFHVLARRRTYCRYAPAPFCSDWMPLRMMNVIMQ